MVFNKIKFDTTLGDCLVHNFRLTISGSTVLMHESVISCSPPTLASYTSYLFPRKKQCTNDFNCFFVKSNGIVSFLFTSVAADSVANV